MALKRKLGSTEFEALTDSALKSEYKKNDADGFYYLDVDDAQELINALKHEREENKSNKEYAASLDKRIKEKEEELARKNGDVAALEASWKEKLKAEKEADRAEKEQLKKIASQGLIDKTLDPLAAKFKSPTLVKKILSERVKVEFGENGPEIRILDKDGKPSALSMSDLEKEILEDQEFKSILVQSRASGSTASSGKSSSGSAETTDKKWSQLTPAEKAEALKAKREQNK